MIAAATPQRQPLAPRRSRPRRREDRDEARVSKALASVGQQLMRTLARPALSEELCRVAAEALGCVVASTLLREQRSGTFLPVAAYGDARRFTQLADATPATLPTTIARLGSEHVVEVEIPGDANALGGEPTHWLAIALEDVDGLSGILFVGRVADARPFSVVEHRIAEGISRVASIALENARLVEELERANRVKSDFVATMSHELRTPLHIMLGYLSLLAEGDFGPLSEDQREVVGLVDRNAHALLELVQDTLDLSRLERESLPLHRREVEPAELLRSLRRDTEKMQHASAVSVSWEVREGLPRLLTDAGKLKLALRNLVSNALKFTPAGTVTVSAQGCGDGVEFSVADTGIGIPPDSFDKIFEPFTQLGATSTRRYGGVGTGLYIARRLTELLGGTIAVKSRSGEGSTFHVWIPSMGFIAGGAARRSPWRAAPAERSGGLSQ